MFLTACDVRAASSKYVSLLNTSSRTRPVTGLSSRWVRRRRAASSEAMPPPAARCQRCPRTHLRSSSRRSCGKAAHHFLKLLHRQRRPVYPQMQLHTVSLCKTAALHSNSKNNHLNTWKTFWQQSANTELILFIKHNCSLMFENDGTPCLHIPIL